MRENAMMALKKDGYVFKYDFSLPLKHFNEVTEVVRERLKETNVKRVASFGHFGDGDTHLNITTKKFDQKVYDL